MPLIAYHSKTVRIIFIKTDACNFHSPEILYVSSTRALIKVL
jgi:hypothetical protein